MFSRIPRRSAVGRGPNITVKLGSARLVGSLPRLQAEVAEVSNTYDTANGGIPPFVAKIPVCEAVSTVRPVAPALPQNRDEFWRKVPLWENVSTEDFLSYRWGVSLSISIPFTASRMDESSFLSEI